MLQGAGARVVDAICIGHSHAAALAAATHEAGVALEVLNFWELPGAVLGEGAAAELAPFVVERLRAPAFSLIGGAVHHDVGLLLHPLPFDFVDPAAPEARLVQGATLIPYDAVLAALRVRSLPYLRLMDCVRAAIQGPMFHMQSPPIFAAERAEEGDPGWIAFHGPGRTIAPAAFRQKLWRMHSTVVADHCAFADIAFVPCPGESMDEGGYLRAGLNGRPAHANAAYGAMVLEQILARI